MYTPSVHYEELGMVSHVWQLSHVQLSTLLQVLMNVACVGDLLSMQTRNLCLDSLSVLFPEHSCAFMDCFCLRSNFDAEKLEEMKKTYQTLLNQQQQLQQTKSAQIKRMK